MSYCSYQTYLDWFGIQYVIAKINKWATFAFCSFPAILILCRDRKAPEQAARFNLIHQRLTEVLPLQHEDRWNKLWGTRLFKMKHVPL